MAEADDDRRSHLRALKLRALVREQLGRDVAGEPATFPPGAAMTVDGEAWVLLEDDPGRRLGAALAWSMRRDARAVNVVAEHDAGALARRGGEFDPPVQVWRVVERSLVAAEPEPLPVPAVPASDHLALVDVIEEGGADPTIEHGVVAGEVRGLEVCRVVDDPFTGAVRLEVGVGVHDREVYTMLHGDVPTAAALASVVRAVEPHRHPDAAQHPLNRIAQERLLRWRLTEDPGLVGLHDVVACAPPVPRPDGRDPVPCVAAGRRADGSAVVVVCSVGVDLDLIPYATDARRVPGVGRDRARRRGEGQAVLVVVPSRDLVPITAEIAGRLVQPLELVSPSG